jgi:hypothetical protein
MAQVFSFHVGPPLNLWEQCSLQSFADHGHEIVLFSYGPLHVPKGVRLESAESIISVAEREHLFSNAWNYAQFSDLFRCELLSRFGGWWVDTDVVCQSETLPSEDVVIGRTLHGGICNAIMKFPARHVLLENVKEHCRANYHAGSASRTAFGPMLFDMLVKKHTVPECEVELFYPIHGHEIWNLGEPRRAEDMRLKTQHCPMLHWFQQFFRKQGLPRDRLPPAASLLAKAFIAHGGAQRRHVSLIRYRLHAKHRSGLMHALRQLQRQLRFVPAALTYLDITTSVPSSAEGIATAYRAVIGLMGSLG